MMVILPSPVFCATRFLRRVDRMPENEEGVASLERERGPYSPVGGFFKECSQFAPPSKRLACV